MKNQFIYFEKGHDHRFGDVYHIGYTSNYKKRRRTYEKLGYELKAAIIAEYCWEDPLHKELDKYRIKHKDAGNELFMVCDFIDNYIEWLLYNNYAGTSYEIALKSGCIPTNVWFPNKSFTNKLDPKGRGVFFRCNEKKPININNKKILNKQSISDEWMTPIEWIDRAVLVLGHIETDPACSSSSYVSKLAKHWYTINQCGLDPRHKWKGPVWLNPPYGKGKYSAKAFTDRLCKEVKDGEVKSAITCLNLDSMTTDWIQPLLDITELHAVPYKRVNFLPPGYINGVTSPSKGTLFSYIGEKPDIFAEIFGKYCRILKEIGG